MGRFRSWLRSALGGERGGHDRRFALLEREIEAINKFPDQNPNPVMRLDRDGHLLYANRASDPVIEALGVRLGDSVAAERWAELASAADASPRRVVELESGRRTFALLPVRVPALDVINLYGTDITAEKVVERFPDRNPNPVMRIGEDWNLIYSNAASAPIVRALGIELGDPIPADIAGQLNGALDGSAAAPEIQGDGRTYRLQAVVIPEAGFTNIYGTDVTAAKALDKFPDRNPNPVLRVARDGRLIYANPASATICRALGATVGAALPADFAERVLAAAETASGETLEIRGEERIFELLVVSVYEFDAINVYGTDVTAAREVERASAENERLLLNILPASIADRLRRGEVVIADRFDEMTVLFADVVGFTQLSLELSPVEIVETLNAVFSAFDRLADRHGLEKIKTIGDAYMVVGGLIDDAPALPGRAAGGDHVQRVAEMGLEMLAEAGRLSHAAGRPLQFRVGMHTGPAVAGVIGIKKFIYDVWGDTVNTASRMESHGVPGRIQVTEATYQRLRDTFAFESRGLVDVKGKGPLPAYLLVGALEPEAAPQHSAAAPLPQPVEATDP